MRHLLVVLGAYFIGATVGQWLDLLYIMLYPGTSYSSTIGMIWSDVTMQLPHVVAGAIAGLLLCYTLGLALARRWVWGLVGISTVLSLLSARGGIGDPFEHAVHIAVRVLLPTIGALVAVFFLQRFLPAGPDPVAIADEPTPRRGGTLVLALTWGLIMFVVGGSFGASMTSTAFLKSSDAMTVAFLGAMRAQYVEAQFREGRYGAAKLALEDRLVYLDTLKPRQPDQPDRPCESANRDAKGLAFERMLTYARLAVTEERVQHADAAAAMWTHAEEQARLLDWTDTSRAAIRRRLGALSAGPLPSPSGGVSPE